MDGRIAFERNLLALAGSDNGLCARLSAAETTQGRYIFLESRSGEKVPAAVDASGSARPLHSLVDPRREAARILTTVKGGFLILFGLGGGYIAEAALNRADIHGLIVIDYDVDGIAELLAQKEYVKIFGDSRVRLLVDPDSTKIEDAIHGAYRPSLSGGISVLPLRARVDLEKECFGKAADSVKAVIDGISDDYSVQAYFGKRWFANAIRNLLIADAPSSPMRPARRVSVTAAGPSLEKQIPQIKKNRASSFLLATDTSLPALLASDVRPDAVISIDCQHISYYHFMDGYPEDIPLFLDLASPPVVASRTQALRFFSGGHPLTVYATRHLRAFPRIDTSGGNVTYAAICLAEKLGAEKVELYGADFSYPGGAPYARGTYIHPYFERAQNRFIPLEAKFASFVFRNESLKLIRGEGSWRYETKPLASYRERLEKLAPKLHTELLPVKGDGAPISILAGKTRRDGPIQTLAAGKAAMSARDFLKLYAQNIKSLPTLRESTAKYIAELDAEQKDVLTTLLPAAAAIKRREPELSPEQTIEAVRTYCLDEINRVIHHGATPT